MKTSILLISKKIPEIDQLPDLVLQGSKIAVVEKVKNLGFYINSSLNCTDHINYVVRRIYIILRGLRYSKEYTPYEIRLRLIKQLIIPLISQFIFVFNDLDSVNCRKLTSAINDATRYVCDLRKYDRLASHRNLILGMSLKDYICFRTCVFLHKLMNTKTPTYLYDKLCLGHSTRNRVLIVPKFRYLESSRLFFVSAIRLWNTLPATFRNIAAANSFKRHLLLHFS